MYTCKSKVAGMKPQPVFFFSGQTCRRSADLGVLRLICIPYPNTNKISLSRCMHKICKMPAHAGQDSVIVKQNRAGNSMSHPELDKNHCTSDSMRSQEAEQYSHLDRSCPVPSTPCRWATRCAFSSPRPAYIMFLEVKHKQSGAWGSIKKDGEALCWCIPTREVHSVREPLNCKKLVWNK